MWARWTVLCLLGAACAQEPVRETPARPDAGPSALPSPVAPSAPEAAPWRSGPIWLLESRALDLTGDGVHDTIFVEARGSRTDSMHIVLGAVVRGDTSLMAFWDGNYELTDEGIDGDRTEPELQVLLRSRLTDVLRSVAVEPFGGASAIGDWRVEDGEPDCIQSVESCVKGSIERAVRDSLLPSSAPFDTALARRALSDLRSPGRFEVVFSYGYESSERVVWSPVLRQFLTVFSCC